MLQPSRSRKVLRGVTLALALISVIVVAKTYLKAQHSASDHTSKRHAARRNPGVQSGNHPGVGHSNPNAHSSQTRHARPELNHRTSGYRQHAYQRSLAREGVSHAAHFQPTLTPAPLTPVLQPNLANQQPFIQTPSNATGRGLSFSFKDAPWELVLRRFAQEAGMSLQMTKLPAGTFTFFDTHQYTPPQALDLINDHLLRQQFILVRSGRNLILFATTERIPGNLIPYVRAEDLNQLGRNELASVAIPIYQGIVQGVEQEVESILGPVGSATGLSSSRRLLVTDTGANLRRIYSLLTNDSANAVDQPTFIYQLKNTTAEEVAKAINEFLATQMGGQVAGRAGGSSLPTSHAVIPEKKTNSVLVRGSLKQVAKIRELVEELDQPPGQVLIQALLVEVELGNTDEFGVELGVQDSVLFDRSVVDNIVTVTETLTSPNGTQTTNQRVISQTAAPGFNFNSQPLGNNVSGSPNSFAGQALSNFGVGRVNGDLGFGGLVLSAGSESVSVLLRALAAKFKVDVLSRPQIRTLDNHEALIQIGRQVPVVDGVSITGVGSANPIIRQDKSGIILKVTPRISPNGLVTISVDAEKSAFQLAPGTGVPIFTDATNGNVIEAPVKDITTASTTVSMTSGQTIVLGGMITRDLVEVRRKVPFLGDIPYLGQLFQYKLDQNTRKELLIFLTPRVIQGEAHSDELMAVESAKIHLPYKDVQMIHTAIPRISRIGHSSGSDCGDYGPENYHSTHTNKNQGRAHR